MSSPRITQRLMVGNSLSAMQLGLSRLSASQEKLSTGRVINRPSDSPTGTNDAMRLRASLAAKTQYASNAEDGKTWLSTADSTLTRMLDQVRRAGDLMLRGASTGSNSPDSNRALAAEIGQIREGLIDEANTQLLGRPIFGGTTAGRVAYDASGAFVGDVNPVNRTIGEGINVAVNITGPAAFSAGGTDLFAVLGDAVTALQTDPTQLATALDNLAAVASTMRGALAEVGTRGNRVEFATSSLESAMLDTRSTLSNIENVDIAAAIVELQLQEVAYQASLGATARVIQPSLIDFLR